MEAISTALTTSFTSVGSELTGIISSLLPIALPIVGGVMVVVIGIKILRRSLAKPKRFSLKGGEIPPLFF